MDDLRLFGALACLILGAALGIFFQPQAFARLRGWATEKRERHTGRRTRELKIPPRHVLRYVIGDGRNEPPTTGIRLSFCLLRTGAGWGRKQYNPLHAVTSGTTGGWIKAPMSAASPLAVTVSGLAGFLIIESKHSGMCFFVRYEKAFEPLHTMLEVREMIPEDDIQTSWHLDFSNHATLWLDQKGDSAFEVSLRDVLGFMWRGEANDKEAMNELNEILGKKLPRLYLASKNAQPDTSRK